MIKLRLNVKEGRQTEFQINDGELLSQAVDRALENIPLAGLKKEDVFQTLVNGHRIDHDMWSFVKLRKEDRVLIAPILGSSDPETDGLLRTIVVVAVTAVAGAQLAGPMGLVGVQLGLATAAVTMATGLLLNALIPPPVPDAGALSASSDLSNSQMYSINSQSNTTRKFGTVPRVYGVHRMFPVVAANPYTELEVDPTTGELVQFFYCIYDFGFGPLKIENIMIGDTPISDFSDVNYSLYDNKKPAVSEGPWDDETSGELLYYKGDVETESVAVVLSGNKDDGGPQSTWQATRNSSPNTDNSPQTITLSFTNPTGLYSFSANGLKAPRSILLEIYFAPVGTEDWIPFNDLNYVKEFKGVGGDQAFNDAFLEIFPPVFGSTDVYSLLYVGEYINTNLYNIWNENPFETPWRVRSYEYGYPVGTTTFILKDSDELSVGKYLRFKKENLGKITSVTEYPGDSDYCQVEIDTPLSKSIKVISYSAGLGKNLPAQMQHKVLEDNTGQFSVMNQILGRAKITRHETSPVYSSFSFTPKNPGQYKVRVTRINTTSAYTTQVGDSLTWTGITTRFDRSPINSDKRHLFFELKIRATNQLNGAVGNLSAVASSVLDVYDPDTQTWSKQVTNNPAWVFVDLLTGEANKRPVEKSRLDLSSIVEWAEFCDEVPTPPAGYEYLYPRFQSNFILDYQTTLQGVINQVTWAAQASLNLVDGKYGVLIDNLKTTPVQVFTPRNSRDFQSSRAYVRKPDGVRIKYVDPSINWEVAETTVYDNGFSEENALDFDEMTSFACTNQEQAWRFGRYMLAQNRLRQETISLNVDFEHLVCTRGDYVQITQDVMKVGGHPARVKSVDGNRVILDDAFELELGPSYGFLFRSPTSGIVTNTLTVISADTFDLDGEVLPEAGDLIIIGVVGQIVYDCIVKSISPNDDLSANIVLVEKADGIYEAESTSVFPEYDPQISKTSNPVAAPGEVENLEVSANTWQCSGAGYRYHVDLDWDSPTNSAFEYFQIFVDFGKGYSEVGTTRNTEYSYTVNEDNLGLLHKFKVIAVSATGKKLDLGAVGAVEATPLVKSTRPTDVQSLAIDITAEVLQLTWPRVGDCDVQEYLIRYTPQTSGATWEASIPVARENRDSSTTAVQARTGTYLIKAVDFAGNESDIAATAVTTIPNLFNLNIIEETDDFPNLEGSFDRTENQGGGVIVLKEAVSGGANDIEYYPEGYYYYKELLDLGEIFTVRLQSLIQAEGFTADDMMSNWVTLSAVNALANSLHSEWDVETQYRTTNSLNLMSDWLNLSDLETIGGGVAENFTEWRKFTMGDATGRIFQFRLKLISNKLSVTPRVFDGKIKADMPDRREEYRNLESSGGTYVLTYTTPFKGPGTTPVVLVSVDDLEGARIIISDKTLSGCKISFEDEDGSPVDKVFDVAVAGYGRQALNVI